MYNFNIMFFFLIVFHLTFSPIVYASPTGVLKPNTISKKKNNFTSRNPAQDQVEPSSNEIQILQTFSTMLLERILRNDWNVLDKHNQVLDLAQLNMFHTF